MRLTPRFLLSAFDPAHFPAADKTKNAPEVAFLGRSNVGKSSLINALLGQTHARVSSTPGRTRSINFFGLYNDPNPLPQILFADLPGYGYAKISKSISAEWQAFIDPYLAERAQLALCICLVDTNIPPQPSDTQLLNFLREIGRPFLVVGTKSDRLSNNTLGNSILALKRAHNVEEVLACSVKDQRNMKALWARILSVGNTSQV
jgi:GTP-binding protein